MSLRLFTWSLLLWWLPLCLGAAPPATLWGEIRLESPLEDGPGIRAVKLEGKPVQERDLEKVINVLLNDLAQGGYPFARVQVAGVDMVDGLVYVVLKVEPGSRAIMDQIVLVGAEVTKNTLAWKLSGLQRGQRFTGSEVQVLEQRLKSSGLFLSVGSAKLRPGHEPGALMIEIPVEEPPYTRFAGVLGVAGKNSDVSGLVDLKLRNIAGTGREVQAGWLNQGRGISRFELQYFEPWLPVIPIGVRGELAHEVREESYSFTRWKVTGSIKPGMHWEVSVGWGGSRSVEVDTTRENARESFAQAGLQLDLRDQALNPGKGLLVSLLSRNGTKTIGGKTHDRTRWDLRGEGYIPTGPRRLLAFSTRFLYLDTPERPIASYDLIPVGGARSLRGYREEQFLTHLGALWQAEWRWVLDGRGSAAFGFVDGGWVASDQGQLQNRMDTFLLGYGVGIRQGMEAGMISVAYGVPQGRPLSSGRIHLQLTADF